VVAAVVDWPVVVVALVVPVVSCVVQDASKTSMAKATPNATIFFISFFSSFVFPGQCLWLVSCRPDPRISGGRIVQQRVVTELAVT
jgi:hypothetical protein